MVVISFFNLSPLEATFSQATFIFSVPSVLFQFDSGAVEAVFSDFHFSASLLEAVSSVALGVNTWFMATFSQALEFPTDTSFDF